MSVVNMAGSDRADVLAALYNNSRPLGMGILHYDPTPPTREEAQEVLNQMDDAGNDWVDYLKGRVMKVRLSKGSSEFSPALYDRDNGDGAAKRAIETLREKGE